MDKEKPLVQIICMSGFFDLALSFPKADSLFMIERGNLFENLGKERKGDYVDADFLLIRKMKQGDDHAIDSFVCKYYSEILKYCSYHCPDKNDAEDLTQETYVHIKHFVLYEVGGQGKGVGNGYAAGLFGGLCDHAAGVVLYL